MPLCWKSHVTAHLSIFYCLFQLLQVYQAKLNYLSWENLIEWITYVTSLLLVIDFEVCQRETGYRQVRITYVTSLLLVIDFEVCQRETGYRQVRITYVTSLLLAIDFEVCQSETGYRQVRITYVTSLLLVIDFEVCQRETGYRQVKDHICYLSFVGYRH